MAEQSTEVDGEITWLCIFEMPVGKWPVHEFRNFADKGLAFIMLKSGLGVLGISESDLGPKP
jgi:hypothetical protein